MTLEVRLQPELGYSEKTARQAGAENLSKPDIGCYGKLRLRNLDNLRIKLGLQAPITYHDLPWRTRAHMRMTLHPRRGDSSGTSWIRCVREGAQLLVIVSIAARAHEAINNP